jgi:hypothetical protein
MRKRTLGYWLVVVAALGSLAAAAASASDSEKESDFKFRFVGPKVGNRVAAISSGSTPKSEPVAAMSRAGLTSHPRTLSLIH